MQYYSWLRFSFDIACVNSNKLRQYNFKSDNLIANSFF